MGARSSAFPDVPEGYFDDLQRKVMQTIEVKPVFHRNLTPVYAIAAVVLLLLTVGVVFFNHYKPFGKEDNAIAQHRFESRDSMNKRAMSSKQNLIYDSIQSDNQQYMYSETDTLQLIGISNEELQQYLIEMEEFEF